LRLGRGSNECGITTQPVLATVEGGSLSPQSHPPEYVIRCVGLGCYPAATLIFIIIAAALLACCVFWAISRLFCKRHPTTDPREAGAGGAPIILVAHPDGRSFHPVVLSAGSGGYAYAQAQPNGTDSYAPYSAQAVPRSALDPAAAAAAAAAADAEADAAFEAATYAAIVASAAEARQQHGGGGGPSRSIQVAYGGGDPGDPTGSVPRGTLTVASLPGMPPPYAPTAASTPYAAAPYGPTAPAAATSASTPAPALAEVLSDYRSNTPAMRALLASQVSSHDLIGPSDLMSPPLHSDPPLLYILQRRALGLPIASPSPVQPPPQQPQQQAAWDPEGSS
jgi:hypothetical protein